MFRKIKEQWIQSGIAASVEGVIREAETGDRLAFQKWYFKYKKEIYKQAVSKGLTFEETEVQAFNLINNVTVNRFLEIGYSESMEGRSLQEINEWLKFNDPR